MLTRRGSCLVTAVSLLIGCTLPEQPAASTTPQLLVQGVIDARANSQVILVSRTPLDVQQDASTAGNGIDGIHDPVAGAMVTLTLPNGQTLLANRYGANSQIINPPGVYEFLTGDFGFDPTAGGTYLVHVRTASGDDISGSTTMPTVPSHLLSLPAVPTSEFRRLQDTVRLSWPRVPGAKSYEVLARAGSVEYRVFTDTSVSLPGTTMTLEGDMVFPPGGAVLIIVSAVDANYYDYYRVRADPFAGAPPSHLTGAVGVFGSIAPILEDFIEVR